MKWLNVVGLIFNLVGAGVIAAGVLASRAAVDRIAAALEVGLGPAAQADRRRQSSFAIVGRNDRRDPRGHKSTSDEQATEEARLNGCC